MKRKGQKRDATRRQSDSDLQKQSTKHLNVSLKNRMGTEDQRGDVGPVEDTEDGEDHTVTRSHGRRAEEEQLHQEGSRRDQSSVRQPLRDAPGVCGVGLVCGFKKRSGCCR